MVCINSQKHKKAQMYTEAHASRPPALSIAPEGKGGASGPAPRRAGPTKLCALREGELGGRGPGYFSWLSLTASVRTTS